MVTVVFLRVIQERTGSNGSFGNYNSASSLKLLAWTSCHTNHWDTHISVSLESR